MARNSSARWIARSRDPKFAVRVILGVLLTANIIAAGLLKFPPGGSAEDLGRQMASLQKQVVLQRGALEQTRQHALAVAEGREEGDKFIQQYFLPLRSASGILNSDCNGRPQKLKSSPNPPILPSNRLKAQPRWRWSSSRPVTKGSTPTC